jgi:hypothetical protein
VTPKHLLPVAVAGAFAATPAYADPEALNPDAFDLSGALDRPVSPTQPGLEIAIGGGYTQGAGGAGVIGSIEDVTGPGGTLELQLGYRATPRFAVSVYGTAARFRHGDAIGDGGRAWGASGGIQVAWHSIENRSLDPWISVGTGWRGLWIERAGMQRTSMQGVELLRVQLGIDYRVSAHFAIAPAIAVSLSTFLVENAAMPDAFTSVMDKRLNLYGFAGCLGRFDIGG